MKIVNLLNVLFLVRNDEKKRFNLAAEKRKAGVKVVLQDINGVKDIDACTEVYEEVMMLVGKAGRETAK